MSSSRCQTAEFCTIRVTWRETGQACPFQPDSGTRFDCSHVLFSRKFVVRARSHDEQSRVQSLRAVRARFLWGAHKNLIMVWHLIVSVDACNQRLSFAVHKTHYGPLKSFIDRSGASNARVQLEIRCGVIQQMKIQQLLWGRVKESINVSVYEWCLVMIAWRCWETA